MNSCFLFIPHIFLLARNPHDRFGKVMVKNLAERGCPLLSVYDYPSMEAQKERFLARGWSRCQVKDMNEIYRSHLDQSEVGMVGDCLAVMSCDIWKFSRFSLRSSFL